MVSLTALAMAAVSDFRHRIIPNPVVVLTACCGLILRLLLEPRTALLGLGIAGVVLLLLGVLAHWQFIGGGDAKLMAAVTLLVAPGSVAGLLLGIAIGGGVLSGLYLFTHLAVRRHGGSVPWEWLVPIARHRSIPYGVAILAGTATAAVNEAGQCFYATC